MIKSTNVSKLRNGEFVAFISNVITIIQKYIGTTIGIAELFRILSELFEPMRGSYKMERGSKITSDLVEKDQKRDTWFQGIRLILIQFATTHPNENMQAKAKDVLDVIEQHGADLHRKSYQEQTAGLNSIQSTIDQSPELLDTLKRLNLMVYYDAMNEMNRAFDQAYLERNTEYAKLPKDKIFELRGEIEDHFTELGQRINAHIILEEDPTAYKAMADELNALVNSYQDLSDRRSSKGNEEEPDSGLDADLDADLEEIEESEG